MIAVSIKKIIVEIKELVLIVLVFLLFSTFIISQNVIPSPSMVSTVNIGDRILVSRLPFYYRLPQQGEIIVFDGPDGYPWIKRVIGMPGDEIDIREGNIYINQEAVDESAYLMETGISELSPIIETVIDYPYTVPEGHYFLLGDNRLESVDCRYIGAISEDKIIGKAFFRIYPFNKIGEIK